MEFGASLGVSNSIQASFFNSSTKPDCRISRNPSTITANPTFSNLCFPILRTSSSNKSCSCRASSTEGDRMAGQERYKLKALSPLDGRYRQKVKDLDSFISEFGLIRYRVIVEIKWLIKLSQIPQVVEVPSFSPEAQSYFEGIIDGFGEDDALEVKHIEKVTNHDARAIEYFLKKKCESHPEVAKVLEFFRFACTSEDINNLACALMLKESLDVVMLPVMDKVIKDVYNMAKLNAHIPMLSSIQERTQDFSRGRAKWKILIS